MDCLLKDAKLLSNMLCIELPLSRDGQKKIKVDVVHEILKVLKSACCQIARILFILISFLFFQFQLNEGVSRILIIQYFPIMF